jgi:SAM-dependent methyltransferase
VAESFGIDAERYDRARPRYPTALVERVVAASPGPDLLDVGIGTGIAARQFRDAGCRVLGVDPDPRMAAAARRHGFPVEVSRFEEWQPAGRVFDIVAAGQTWHWVEPVAGAAKAGQVLRPGGRLVLFWNVLRPSDKVAAAFAAVYRRTAPSLPFDPWASADPYAAIVERTAEGLSAFGTPEVWRFAWEHEYSRDDWLDQVPTGGGHHLLPPGEQAGLLTGLGAAIDELGGRFTMPYTTVVVTATTAG